jgi:PIN domain nuclease of toxin-antitoxin system
VIVLDTHVLVWFALDDKRLGARARRRIRDAIATGSAAVSAFSYWEVALLATAGRLRIEGPPDAFRAEALERGIGEIPVDGRIAITATRLAGMHSDPADRLIVATALENGATLVTADATILDLKSGPPRLDAQT